MNKYDIWLGNAKISNNEKINMIKKYKTSESLWYYIINESIHNLDNLEICRKLKSAWNKVEIDKIEKTIEKSCIKYVTYLDDNFPERLRSIDNPPFILFYYGDIKRLNYEHSVSVVGSRNCSPYGINVTKFITKEICANNINIISGMAKGIDSIAHKAALENNGYTCAVLGSGIDVVYPRENRFLYEELIKKGCVISEFFPGTPPNSYNFPQRNRIISGLSDLIIIVEAGIKSGSLITASAALDQGKDVISIPGSIFSEQSKGTNKLIKDGAYPFTAIEDIFELIGVESNYNKNKNISVRSDEEHRIYSILSDSPLHIDDIIRMVNIDIKRLYELLFEMQLKDEILCLSGNYYVKVGNS